MIAAIPNINTAQLTISLSLRVYSRSFDMHHACISTRRTFQVVCKQVNMTAICVTVFLSKSMRKLQEYAFRTKLSKATCTQKSVSNRCQATTAHVFVEVHVICRFR